MMNKADNTTEKIIKGLEETYKKMVEFKKQKNSPLVVYKDGKIVELDPFEASPTTKYSHGPK
ncbi:hypothetical protein KZP23_02955 [Echinicola marina]|uniref:hypothetical protein n=1 Tax=Echinicola marina TaxID=2859768 RepID=UPI001CF69EDC|nr:hypothetical protein [Echinicola marina]UCS94007.1 hypothetical protein KZP23_02955 [Echinicola marina]